MTEKELQNIINEIKTKTNPSIFPDADIFHISKKTILVLSVKEFPIKPVAVRGKYYKRIKNSNHELSLQEISDMHLRTYNQSWDCYATNNYTINDISEDKIRSFINKVNSSSDNKIDDNPIQVLMKYELFKNDKITNACHLLFSKNDIFTAAIEVGRFSDPISIKDGTTIQSDLFQQVEEVIAFIKKHINKEYIITGNPEREERWQYPISAIREIVINMIVHRDYTHYGASSVKIFNEQIEFYNPGKLPDSISIEQIFSGNYISEIRNIRIAGIFKEIKLIEKYGSGFSRIIKPFKTYNLKAPVFENFQSGFKITIFANTTEVGEKVGGKVGEKVGEKITGNQQKILELMQNNPYISAPLLSEKVGISKRKIETNIKRLKELKYLKRIGSSKGGHWEITKHE